MSALIKSLFLLILFLICFLTRKKAIGGWLLFYFISIFLSIFVWLAIAIPSFFLLGPSSWHDMSRYLIYFVMVVPNYVLFWAQTCISIMLILQRFRNWQYVNYLRIALLSQIIFLLILLPIDICFFRESAIFDIVGLVYPIIWLLYFTFSRRVRSVYEKKDWVLKTA